MVFPGTDGRNESTKGANFTKLYKYEDIHIYTYHSESSDYWSQKKKNILIAASEKKITCKGMTILLIADFAQQ